VARSIAAVPRRISAAPRAISAMLRRISRMPRSISPVLRSTARIPRNIAFFALPSCTWTRVAAALPVCIDALPGRAYRARPTHMSSAKVFHVLVALNLPRTHADTGVYAGHIVQQMTGTAHFPSPPVALATVTSQLQAYQAAAAQAKGHGTGDAPAAGLLYTQVVTDLHLLANYAQQVADQAPDAATAGAIIASAGFGTHQHGVHMVPALAAHMGVGGVVLLRAHAVAKKAAYEWETSADGKTWTPLPATDVAHTSVPGLTMGQTVWFRVRGNAHGQTGSWTDAVAVIVH
jgi:hypothetical protein